MLPWKWIAWLVFSLGLALCLSVILLTPRAKVRYASAPSKISDLPSLFITRATAARTIFLPGSTSDGHYQIELACESCHEGAFTNIKLIQKACVRCHGSELDRVDDSHPQHKFTDPRNAERIEVLDARWCVTCHQEHRPEITSTMGLSLPEDYCYRCHAEIGEERPTHKNLPFTSCNESGCHNFHDNQAIYEDFLVSHRNEPDLKTPAQVPGRQKITEPLPADVQSLSVNDHDAPEHIQNLDLHVQEWAQSRHAQVGINCSSCHRPESSPWSNHPTLALCQSCHEAEAEGFLGSRHGMRMGAELGPMSPGLARLPMKPEASTRHLSCNSCHPAHRYNTTQAATKACMGCHADDHTLAYETSTHAQLWQSEADGVAEHQTGVSCATCHLPRETVDLGGEKVVRVRHNQNDYLRPNEKMIRPVCIHCHGLGFSLNALADPQLIRSNFRGQPQKQVESINYATVLRWTLEGRVPPWAKEKKDINFPPEEGN